MENQENSFTYDFAISYAGEDKDIASGIYHSIKEKHGDYNIFYAEIDINKITGQDGEKYFEHLFSTSKQVIVIISESYKKKEWTRYEWDIIKERSEANRFIPIRIDNTKILGLPSNYIYKQFDGNNEEVARLCIEKLIEYEIENGIERKTEFQKNIDYIKNSRGSLDMSYQLVRDNRNRSTMENIAYPNGAFNKSFTIINIESKDFSKIKRLIIRLDIKDYLSEDEVKYNIKYCTAEIFNEHKPDAIGLFVYCSEASNFLGFETKFNVARADFAPYGDWEKAQDGFAYNLPSSTFDWKIEFEKSYFDKSKSIQTSEEFAKEIVLQIIEQSKQQ